MPGRRWSVISMRPWNGLVRSAYTSCGTRFLWREILRDVSGNALHINVSPDGLRAGTSTWLVCANCDARGWGNHINDSMAKSQSGKALSGILKRIADQHGIHYCTEQYFSRSWICDRLQTSHGRGSSISPVRLSDRGSPTKHERNNLHLSCYGRGID